jgi:hypothetical protein
MAVLAVFLALAAIGLLVLLILCFVDDPPKPEPVANEDVAMPYREALHAAFRIQQAAWIAEQQLYAESIRHADSDPGDER